MRNSTFSTRLRIAMKNMDEYHIDNGKRKCTKRFTNEVLAEKLGYSRDTVNAWTKKNGTRPTTETLIEIARVLNVDVAYLIGEQDCQHNIDQTICNKTKMNEMSAKVLSSLDGIEADIMNELLNHDNFERLILLSWDYTHSHNKEVKIINTLDSSKDLPLVDDAQKEMMKYRAIDAFGKILDDIYDTHEQEAIDAKISSIMLKMKKEIESFIDNKNNSKIRKGLIDIISYRQNEIKELCADSIICKFSPEQIIENYDLIKNAI